MIPPPAGRRGGLPRPDRRNGRERAAVLRPRLCQGARSGVAEGGQVRLEAEDRAAVPGGAFMDEADQDVDEVLVRFDVLEPVLEHRGLPLDMPGERLRLEIGQAGEVVGDRPEWHVRPGGDVPMRRPRHSVLRDDVEGDVQDACPAVGVVATGPPPATWFGGSAFTTDRFLGGLAFGRARRRQIVCSMRTTHEQSRTPPPCSSAPTATLSLRRPAAAPERSRDQETHRESHSGEQGRGRPDAMPPEYVRTRRSAAAARPNRRTNPRARAPWRPGRATRGGGQRAPGSRSRWHRVGAGFLGHGSDRPA